MAIKQQAELVYFSEHPKQLELAKKFDEAFDINYGDTIEDLSFWVAEPKPHTKERFGLNQEILIIYSPFQKTDARIFKAIELIFRKQDFKHRLDKVLILLVHNGDLLETWDLIKTRRDWIVVPFFVNELFDNSRGSLFIRTRISQVTGSIDLFGMSSPITNERYFFGRDELVQTLISRSTIKNESSGLFGLRKTGKTSVLYAVQRRLFERPVIAEYIDCQNPGIHAARWWQVLETIIKRLSVAAQQIHHRYCLTSENYLPIDAGTKFAADIKTILGNCNLDHVILMLDEIEYITPSLSGALGQHWDTDFLPFWQTLRSIHQETLGKFTFIVAGVNPACVEKSHFKQIPNPIFQLAVPQYLEPLSEKNIREMVRTIGRYAGLKFQEDIYKYLEDRFGGHPYLIRIACSEVWKKCDKENPEKLEEVKKENFIERNDEIKARLSQPIKDILLSLVWWYPDEYDLLRILASGDTDFVADYIKELHEEQQPYLVQFARYGLLKPNREFAIANLRDFLNEHGEAYKNEISPFTRGDMPPEFLPAVPDLKILGQLFDKKCELEIKLRKLIIMYLGVSFSWDNKKISDVLISALGGRKERKNPADLFVGNTPQKVMNDLYTLDLKDIIIKNWELFNSLFDNNKVRFEMNMDTINKARRVESHTKPFTKEEIEEFNNSYSWIFSKISKVPSL